MGYLSGTSGFVKLGATDYAFGKWKIALRSGAPKVTNFTSGGYQEIVGGVIAGTITLNGPYNQGAMALAANTSYVFHLGMDTGVEFSLTARITNLEVDNDTEDAPRVTVTAESSGSFTASIS